MRILLLHQYFLEDHGAGGSRWNEMTRIWVAAGHSVTVIAGDVHYMRDDARHQKGRLLNRDGVEVIRCKVSKHYHKGFTGRFRAYISFALASIYAGLRLANGRYDCIIVSSPPLLAGIPGVVLSKCKHIPMVLEIRDLWPESAIEVGVLKNKWLIRLSYWLEKYLYRHAKLINVVTPAFREHLIAKKAVPVPQIVMIPNAADFRWSDATPDDASKLRNELGLDGKFVIIYVGAHGLANDLMQLIEAAALLAGTPAHFLLIGDGMQKQMLMQKVQERRLTNVSFLAPVSKEKVFAYIRMADAGVAVLKKAPIFKTIYSNKTFDYLSCKKPVLMVIDGISRELIEQVEAGLFAEQENPADLAAKISIYMQNPLLVQRHGENGYQFVRGQFDREILAKNFLNALENAVLKKGQASCADQPEM